MRLGRDSTGRTLHTGGRWVWGWGYVGAGHVTIESVGLMEPAREGSVDREDRKSIDQRGASATRDWAGILATVKSTQARLQH